MRFRRRPIETGKLGDVIVVDGHPHARIGDIRKVHTVVKDGVAVTSADVLTLGASR